MIIYAIKNKVNGKLYVGKTEGDPDRRWTVHKSFARRGDGTCRHLYRALRKYGEDAFTFWVIDRCSNREELDECERFWIRELKPAYNIREGGDGGSLAPESIAKIKAARALQVTTPATAAKIAAGNRGKVRTPEMRARYSAARRKSGHLPMKGRKHSPETIEKIRASAQAREARRRLASPGSGTQG